jgi:hypothetical protein
MKRRMLVGACALALTLGSAGIARAEDPPPAPDPPNSDALINIGIEGVGRLGVNAYAESLLPICVSLRIGPTYVIPWTCIPGPAA